MQLCWSNLHVMKIELDKKVINSWVCLHRAHRQLLEKVESELKLSQLPTLDWYDVLLELYRDEERGLRQYEIGEKVLLNKHNLSRLIDRLEKNQLVSKNACAEDGRGNRITITNEGRILLKQVWPVYSRSIKESFGDKLTNKEVVQLSRILTKLLD